MLDSLLNKVEGPQACNFTKKGDSNTGLFCCEKYEHFKNTYFEEHLQATASEKRVCNVRITKNWLLPFFPVHTGARAGWRRRSSIPKIKHERRRAKKWRTLGKSKSYFLYVHNVFFWKIYTCYSRYVYHWRLQFNLTSWLLYFIERDNWAYQGIIYLR